jgi:methionine aminopeptidase
MLAKLSTAMPEGEQWLYEPKWDGFRALVFRDGDELLIQSRDLKPLGRYFPELDAPLREGTVITIEPILGLGSSAVRAGDDGWTILTADGAPSAHAEHTLVVSAGEPLVLTAAG